MWSQKDGYRLIDKDPGPNNRVKGTCWVKDGCIYYYGSTGVTVFNYNKSST